MKKIVHIGRGEYGHVFAEIEITTPEAPGLNNKIGVLSISGVEGPMRNGDARGGWGQIVDSFTIKEYAPGWTHDLLVRFLDVWRRWHLNDMHACCKHQRAEWDTTKKIEVVSYGLTSEAYHRRVKLMEIAAMEAAKGNPPETAPAYTDQDRALLGLADWFKDRHAPPDADDPLSGCYEVKKRETKGAGWVYETEHPEGLLMKPCPTCGYKYGSAWLFEPLPEDVIAFLGSLPETDITPAWV